MNNPWISDMQRDKYKPAHPSAPPQQYRHPNNGTEGGGVGYGLSRIQPGPGQASQQDPKSQPQQSLPPGPMQMGYQPNPRGAQQYYSARPQPRLQNSAPRMGGVQPMQGTAVFATLPSGNMFGPQGSIVSGQVPTSILIPPVQYMAARHHGQASGQAASNQQQNFYQLPQYMTPQAMGPPPFSNYHGPVYMPQPIRSQFPAQNSTQNQVPQQQPTQQQSAVQPLYVEQVGGGGPQVAMSSMSGGPGGPNGTPHIMGSQAPNSISLVQNPGAIPSGANMMQNPQVAKEKKVRKFAIPIIDPDSGQNVLLDEDKDGVSHSADSSASHTPQPQLGKENDDIKAKQVVGEFAFKVAAVAFVGEPAPSAAAPVTAPSAPPHIEERLNGPVDHSHENELVVKEPSPAPPSAAVTPQLTAPLLTSAQPTAPQQTAPQAPVQLHPSPPAFVPTVSASTNSPLVELHRPSAPSMSAVVKQLPPGSSGPPPLQQVSQAPTPAPAPALPVAAHTPAPVAHTPAPVAHTPAPAVAPVPPPSTSPSPPAPAPVPVQTPPAAPQPSPPPAQTAPPPQAPATARKTQVMGPPTESAAVPAKKGGKKESGSGAGNAGGAGRGTPAGGRPGSASTPPPAATTTVVGPPPAPAGAPKSTVFSEMTNFKNFAPSSNTTAPAPAPAPTPAPAPVEDKGTNGETETQVGKAIQRPKQKKGGKVRGVDKGGTEMDAFVEPAPTPVAAPPPARDPTPPPREPTPPATAPEPKARPVENSTAPVIEQLIQPEVEAEETGSVAGDDDYSAGTDVDAMVAAKNEENAKVSAAAAAAAANNNNNITSSAEKEDGEVVVDGEAEEDETNDIKSMTIERSPAASQSLKYNYRDGQWSPANREGKKVYDRDFLLEIKNSTLALQKPEFTLELDIFRDKPNDYAPNNSRKNLHGSVSMGNRGDNPSPYRNSSSSSSRPVMKVQGGVRGPPRMGPSISHSGGTGMRGTGGRSSGYATANSQYMVREPEPILHKDPNGWKPARKQNNLTDLSDEQKQIEKLQKNVRGILNKLTPQKFDKLVGKILEIPTDTESHLREMVTLVFEKAVDEPSFSKAYADLCNRLQKKMIQKMENSGESDTVVAVSFRKLLLNKCQEGFETNKKDELNIAQRVKEIEETPDPEKKKELKLLLDDAERKIRRKSVGLVRFIGELYKLHMLTPKIMHGCISTLLSQVAEEPLECLCKLLTTIGKELERESTKKEEFDDYFAQMSKLAQKTPDSKVSSRIRFMLQDVLELRQKNWKPRRDENNPKTIEQIHKDAERDAALESAILSAPMHQGPKGRHPSDGRRNPRSNQDSDGWQMSGSKYRPSSTSYTNTVEPAKLQHFTKQSQSDAGDAAISLGGSAAFQQWTTGASSKRTSGPADNSRSGPPPSSMNANRFALLGQSEDSRNKYSSSMSKGKGVSGSTSLEKDSRSIGGMMRGDRDRDGNNMRRMGSGPSSRENSRHRYAQPGHSPAGSLNSRIERDYTRSEQPSSRGGHQVDNREATEARVPPADVPDVDEDEGQRKADTIFDEWCANNNAEETSSTISDTFVGTKNARLLVRLLLNKVIEGKPHTRPKYGELLVVMLQLHHHLSSKDVITEFQEMIEYGDEMVVDIPFFWSHIGQIFAPLISNEVVSFDELKTALSKRPVQDRAKVVSEVFKTLQQNEKTSVWTSSNSKLTDFVPEKEIENFVKSNNFWFLTGNAEPTVDWRKHRDHLVTILQGPDSDKAMDDAHAFLAKIEGTVSKKAFIEIVTMAVIKASLKEGKLVARQISKFDKLILKYVDNTEELELICLFAIKNFVVIEATLELTVLTESFRHLYDDSIISVEAFNKWKDDTSIEPQESEGRLLATRTLEPFYVFLAEPDEEEEDS